MSRGLCCTRGRDMIVMAQADEIVLLKDALDPHAGLIRKAAMYNSTQAFLEPLEKWVKAVREDDFENAKHHAEHLLKAGELLVIHPDFQRNFMGHCGGFDPHQALFHMCQFLVCTTDGRAKIMKQYVKDYKPKPGA